MPRFARNKIAKIRLLTRPSEVPSRQNPEHIISVCPFGGFQVSFPRHLIMDSKKLALLCRELADNRKAEDLVVLDVRELSTVTDYFVIASGSSEPHLRAIVDEITDTLREEHDVRPRAADGTLHTGWVVLDFFDVIVHVMKKDVRERYDLETLWGDAPQVKPKKSPRKSAKGN